MKKVPPAAILGVIPFVLLVGALPFVNRVHPIILGFPFVLFWILMGVLLTPAFLWAAQRRLRRRNRDAGGGRS